MMRDELEAAASYAARLLESAERKTVEASIAARRDPSPMRVAKLGERRDEELALRTICQVMAQEVSMARTRSQVFEIEPHGAALVQPRPETHQIGDAGLLQLPAPVEPRYGRSPLSNVAALAPSLAFIQRLRDWGEGPQR